MKILNNYYNYQDYYQKINTIENDFSKNEKNKKIIIKIIAFSALLIFSIFLIFSIIDWFKQDWQFNNPITAVSLYFKSIWKSIILFLKGIWAKITYVLLIIYKIWIIISIIVTGLCGFVIFKKGNRRPKFFIMPILFWLPIILYSFFN